MKATPLAETEARPNLESFLDELARSRKSVLLLDYDGTLAPFQVERDRAFPYPGVSTLLQDIMNAGRTRVVVITGRRAQEIVPLLGIASPPEILGAYGLQRLKPDGTCEMPAIDDLVVQALAAASEWLNELGFGNQTELKPGSVAVHWRGLEDSLATRIRGNALLGWLPIADRAGLTIEEFDGGVEVKMPGFNKGNAVRDLLAEFDSPIPVAYLGDDQADEDAFRVLQNRGLRVLVRREWRQTEADLWLRPPAELVNFLFQWLAVCRGVC
jgi:trehalose 6-phosphate phosphatase